jgi:hypothetical protein
MSRYAVVISEPYSRVEMQAVCGLYSALETKTGNWLRLQQKVENAS